MVRLSFVLISMLALLALFTGCDNEFPETPYPRVETLPVANISENGFALKGNLTWGDSQPITDHGFLWGTSANLSLNSAENKVLLGSRTSDGQFEASINFELSDGQTYFVRAFATTSSYTVYGKMLSFTSEGSE